MKTKEKASALLTALFITVIVALLTTSTAYKFRLVAHLAALNNNTNQLILYASGLSKVAETRIANYINAWQQQPKNQSPILIPPSSISPTTLNDVALHARIVDASSLFNINNLAYPNTQQGFIHLLNDVVPMLSPQKALTLTNNITDWLLPSTNNNADQLYATYNPPYRAAHQPMLDTSELRQVAGITPAIFNAISPYITALPTTAPGVTAEASGQPTPININTASIPVLLTTSSQMTIAQAEQLYNCRLAHGIFRSMSEVMSCPNQTSTTSLTGLAVYSNYFIVYSTAVLNNQRATLMTLVSTHQNSGSKVAHSYIVWQMLK